MRYSPQAACLSGAQIEAVFYKPACWRCCFRRFFFSSALEPLLRYHQNEISVRIAARASMSFTVDGTLWKNAFEFRFALDLKYVVEIASAFL